MTADRLSIFSANLFYVDFMAVGTSEERSQTDVRVLPKNESHTEVVAGSSGWQPCLLHTPWAQLKACLANREMTLAAVWLFLPRFPLSISVTHNRCPTLSGRLPLPSSGFKQASPDRPCQTLHFLRGATIVLFIYLFSLIK